MRSRSCPTCHGIGRNPECADGWHNPPVRVPQRDRTPGKLVHVPLDAIRSAVEGDDPDYVDVFSGQYRAVAVYDGDKVKVSRLMFEQIFEVEGLWQLPVSVEAYNQFIDECCLNIPESYEATEGSAESCIVRYIRDLEAGIDAARDLLGQAMRIETRLAGRPLYGLLLREEDDAEAKEEPRQAGEGQEQTEEADAGAGDGLAAGTAGEPDTAPRCRCTHH